ncbi:MAG: transcriptional regulator, partial [Proteobacteria bacterium]|nr:transcriptional regulator [Pseudomonadota bacterium]
GANRIGASRLFQFAKALGVPVGYFFSDLDDRLGDPRAGYEIGLMFAATGMPSTVAENRRETIELIRAFNRIGDPRLRSAVQRMAEFLASAATGPR